MFQEIFLLLHSLVIFSSWLQVKSFLWPSARIRHASFPCRQRPLVARNSLTRGNWHAGPFFVLNSSFNDPRSTQQQHLGQSQNTTQQISELIAKAQLQPNELSASTLTTLINYPSVTAVKTALDEYTTLRWRQIKSGLGSDMAHPDGIIASLLNSYEHKKESLKKQYIDNCAVISSGSSKEVTSTTSKQHDQQVKGVVEHMVASGIVSSGELESDIIEELCYYPLEIIQEVLAEYIMQASQQPKRRVVIKKDGSRQLVFDAESPSTIIRSILERLVNLGVSGTDKCRSRNEHENQSMQPREEKRDFNPTTAPPSTRSAIERHPIFHEVAPSTPVKSSHVDSVILLLTMLEKPVDELRGVGAVTASLLQQMNLPTIRSLLWHFPSSVIDRTKLIKDVRQVDDGDICTMVLKIEEMQHGRKVLTLNCRDESNNKVKVIFFHGDSKIGRGLLAGIKKQVSGERMVFSGKVQYRSARGSFAGGFEIVNPDVVCPVDEIDSALVVEPVYRLTKGLTQKKMRQAVDEALKLGMQLLQLIPETLPAAVRNSLSWPTFAEALFSAHHPASAADVGPNSPARKRIAFEEMCVQQAQLALRRWDLKSPPLPKGMKKAAAMSSPFKSWEESPLLSLAISLLPFSLTDSQRVCLGEAWNDSLNANSVSGRMERVLQGETGSGKTVVGYLLGLGCFEARVGGANVCALLAPTTLLAEQHTRSLRRLVSKLNASLEDVDSKLPIKKIHVELLTGHVTGRRREEILMQIENCSHDEAFFLVGTHALLTPETSSRLQRLRQSSNMGYGVCLAIIDEEQRFGVRQRESLAMCSAHTLYISATPIPRTIALGGSSANIVVGSLDVSTLSEKPKGAREVKTSIIDISRVEQVISGVQRQISRGAKVFWIMPAIGTDDEDSCTQLDDDAPNRRDLDESSKHTYKAIDRHASLRQVLGDDRIGLVHGRMAQNEREMQIQKFKDPDSGVDVMVGTTVLEVGVDIPSVTILVVEGAERFGLSQLHQLRGRVGRVGETFRDVGDGESPECHCVLMTKSSEEALKSSLSMKRLQVIRECDDGAQIALADFSLRGPGDLLGRRQSGFRNGYSIDAWSHWGMIAASSKLGRAFLEDYWKLSSAADVARNGIIKDKRTFSDQIVEFGCSREGIVIEAILGNGWDEPFYNDASASTMSGLVLRTSLALFGNWKPSSEQQQGTVYYFSVLRQALQFTGRSSVADEEVERKFFHLSQLVLPSKNLDLPPRWKRHPSKNSAVISSAAKPPETTDDQQGLTGKVEASRIYGATKENLENPVDTRSPDETASFKIIHASNFQGASLQDDDPIFLLLDVETTGLSHKTSYIIQLAAKVLGSEEIFCEYALPPGRSISPLIEQLTGITDDFLRNGGVDSYSGVVRSNPAEDFRSLYNRFCGFCQKINGGKRKICLVAHNAAFDIRMLNEEVKRLALAESRSQYRGNVPVGSLLGPMLSRDTGITTTVDTLRLFKTNKLWQSTSSSLSLIQSSSKPSSFSLGDLYRHILRKEFDSAHNAVADILALEEILSSPQMKDKWMIVADDIQVPLFLPNEDVN